MSLNLQTISHPIVSTAIANYIRDYLEFMTRCYSALQTRHSSCVKESLNDALVRVFADFVVFHSECLKFYSLSCGSDL